MKMYKYEKLFNRDVKNLINKNLNVVMETIMFYIHVRTMDHWGFRVLKTFANNEVNSCL